MLHYAKRNTTKCIRDGSGSPDEASAKEDYEHTARPVGICPLFPQCSHFDSISFQIHRNIE